MENWKSLVSIVYHLLLPKSFQENCFSYTSRFTQKISLGKGQRHSSLANFTFTELKEPILERTVVLANTNKRQSFGAVLILPHRDGKDGTN